MIFQDFEALARYAAQIGGKSFLDVISDFHVLTFMASTEEITLQVGNCLAMCKA